MRETDTQSFTISCHLPYRTVYTFTQLVAQVYLYQPHHKHLSTRLTVTYDSSNIIRGWELFGSIVTYRPTSTHGSFC